jgi:hypothetical protein
MSEEVGASREILDMVQLEAMAKCTISFNYDSLTCVLANILSKLKAQDLIITNLQLNSVSPSPPPVAAHDNKSDAPQKDNVGDLGEISLKFLIDAGNYYMYS